MPSGTGGTVGSLQAISSALRQLQEDSSQTAAQVGADMQKLSSGTKAAVTEVKTATDSLATSLADLASSGFDKLDELRNRLKDSTNLWSQEVSLQLAAVEAGAESVDQFMTKFGDAVVQTAEGSKTIRELLEGLDLRKRSNEIQEFIKDLRNGSKNLTDVSKLLSETGFVVAKQLADMITAFKTGKATLQQVLSLIQSIKNKFPGSDLDNLVDALKQQLLQNQDHR